MKWILLISGSFMFGWVLMSLAQDAEEKPLKGWRIYLCIIGFTLALIGVSPDANAMWVGYGRLSDEGSQRADGSWRQYGPGVFFKRNDKSMGYQIEFGGKTKWKWLGFTVGYQDTGSKSLYGRWLMTDEDYFAKRFDADKDSALLQTHSRGFVFTLDPQYTTKGKRWTFYAKLGVKAWRSKTKYCSKAILSSCPSSGWFQTFRDHGVSFYRAKGIQFNFKRSAIYFEHGIAKGDYDTVSFIKNSRPYIAGVRWRF